MPIDRVTINEGGVQKVTVKEGGVKIIVAEPSIKIVTVGIQGPSGPQGLQGPQGEQGEQGIQGDPGEGGDATFVHEQLVASNSWVVNHNLGKFPSFVVIDSGGNLIWGDPDYVDNNTIILNFSVPFGGKAYLN